MTYSIKSFQEKINQKYPEENLTVLIFSGIKDICEIKCNICGKIYHYSTADSAVRRGKKVMCHNCRDAINKKKRFEQSLKDLFPKDDLEIVEFTNSTSPCKIRCKTCGTVYSYNEARRAKRKTRNLFCSTCFPFKSNIIEKTRKDFFNFINDSEQWELVQNIDNVHADDLIKCKCKKCGHITAKTMVDYFRGRGCIYCSDNKQKTTAEFAKELDPGYKLLTEYVNANTKVLLEHECGLKYYTTPHNYLSGRRCPSCSRKQSKGEKKIEQYFLSHDIEYEKEFPLFINGHLLRIDFYLPSHDLSIEFNGIQHYESIDFFGGEDRLAKQQAYDELKKSLLKDKLLIIPYFDIDNISVILDNALKSND